VNFYDPQTLEISDPRSQISNQNPKGTTHKAQKQTKKAQAPRNNARSKSTKLNLKAQRPKKHQHTCLKPSA
jgi:hypothetical protein